MTAGGRSGVPGALGPFVAAARADFDLTDPADQPGLLALADAVLESAVSTDELRAVSRDPDCPLELRVASQLVASRRLMASIAEPARVGVVFAMWGEVNRLRPRTPENPTGEDALRVKLDQLAWVSAGTPVDWTLYPVDDGCPYGSGQIAQELAAEHELGDRARVLFLAEHVPAPDGPLRGLASVDDSRKAGAVMLGCQRALADGAQAVVYTDADSSVHLGQLGLLLAPFVRDGVRMVLGNRQDPDAVLVKEGDRWGVGIKSLRHMQRMVGEAIFSKGIRDTQAAFKLFEAGLLEAVLADPTVFDFSFDTDWMAAAIALDEPFAQTPFAFVDSAEESASAKQQPMTTWYMLLHGLVAAMRRRRLLRTECSREMAQVVEEEIVDHRDLDVLIDDLPPELLDAGEDDYGDPAVMSPAAMRAWIRERKRVAARW